MKALEQDKVTAKDRKLFGTYIFTSITLQILSIISLTLIFTSEHHYIRVKKNPDTDIILTKACNYYLRREYCTIKLVNLLNNSSSELTTEQSLTTKLQNYDCQGNVFCESEETMMYYFNVIFHFTIAAITLACFNFLCAGYRFYLFWIREPNIKIWYISFACSAFISFFNFVGCAVITLKYYYVNMHYKEEGGFVYSIYEYLDIKTNSYNRDVVECLSNNLLSSSMFISNVLIETTKLVFYIFFIIRFKRRYVYVLIKLYKRKNKLMTALLKLKERKSPEKNVLEHLQSEEDKNKSDEEY